MSSIGGGGDVVEAVISAFSLDASAYVSGAKTILDTDQKLIASANAVATAYRNAAAAMKGVAGPGGASPGTSPGASGSGSSGGSSGSGFGLGVGGAYILIRGIRMIESAMEDLGKKFVDVSEDALKQYAAFNTLERSFIGIYGTADKAAQMMNYLRDVAVVSPFQFEDLANASRGLAVAGLNVNRFLPLVQGFALAMGQINGEGLEDFVGILRRIQGGNTGFALGPRGIGRYGVSRAELEQYGAKFGGQNNSHFLGSVNEAFDAIEKVFKARFQKIAESVTASAEVVLSNWGDVMQQAQIDFGAGMAQSVIEPIKEATAAVNMLRQSGFFKDLGDTIYTILGRGFEGSDAPKYKFDSDKEAQAYKRERFHVQSNDETGELPTSTGDQIADLLVTIGGAVVYMAELLKEEVEGAQSAWPYLKALYLVGKATFEAFVGQEWSAWDDIKAAANALAGTKSDDPTIGPEAERQSFMRNAYKRAESDWYQRYLHPDKYGAPTAPTGNAIPGLDNDAEPGESKMTPEQKAYAKYLKEISEYTKRLYEHFEHEKRTAFGGGSIGAIGITNIEMSKYYKGHGKGIKGTVEAFGISLENWIEQKFYELAKHALAQGYFAGQARM